MDRPQSRTRHLNPAIRQALHHLFVAHTAAVESGGSLWEHALSLPMFDRLRMRPRELRWLVRHSFAEHRIETAGQTATRVFRPANGQGMTSLSHFVLTPLGVALAASLETTNAAPGTKPGDSGPTSTVRHTSDYAASQRMLIFQSQVVKEFRVPARNQELILLAFEEESWPQHLSDPLPGTVGIDSKRRLNDAIKNLNAHHRIAAIRFHGDGTGMGLMWRKLP